MSLGIIPTLGEDRDLVRRACGYFRRASHAGFLATERS